MSSQQEIPSVIFFLQFADENDGDNYKKKFNLDNKNVNLIDFLSIKWKNFHESTKKK